MFWLEQWTDVLGRPAPIELEALRDFAAQRGWEARGPAFPVHPLVTPLFVREGEYVGVLHWPTPGATHAPVVRIHPHHVELLDASIGLFLRHEMAKADAGGELAGNAADGDVVYATGELKASGLPLVPWVILRGGGAPWAYQSRIDTYVAKEDWPSALATVDRLADRYPGWAAPQVQRVQLYERAGQRRVAVDAAMTAMSLPMWTAGPSREAAAVLQGWTLPMAPDAYRRMADDESRNPADRAAYAMDAACLAGDDWEALRSQLSAWYDAADLAPIARLVRGDWRR